MRIGVTHQTSYSYPEPVRAIHQVLRLSPRDHEGQIVENWRVSLSLDGRLRVEEDSFGNIVHKFEAESQVTELAITAEGVVQTTDTAGVLRGIPERVPPDVFLRMTPLTQPSDAMAVFATESIAGLSDPLGQLHALLAALHRVLRPLEDVLGPTLGAQEAFAAGAALPRDLAHVFIGCARHLGHPARLVTGYLALPLMPGRAQGLHAWAEAHVAGLGWIGFDVAIGLSPGASHVRLASGFDYGDVTPIRGARKGGGLETMSLSLDVRQFG
jgi:transglutaminase-like putative cysteine protease